MEPAATCPGERNKAFFSIILCKQRVIYAISHRGMFNIIYIIRIVTRKLLILHSYHAQTHVISRLVAAIVRRNTADGARSGRRDESQDGPSGERGRVEFGRVGRIGGRFANPFPVCARERDF